MSHWIDQVQFNEQGLIPVIAQDWQTHKVLMMAWMNRESLMETVERRIAVYWSRSRQRLWRKGEQSGHWQKVHDIALDCDGDAIVMQVEQIGSIACHTGRETCFYYHFKQGQWVIVEPVLKDPNVIYQHE